MESPKKCDMDMVEHWRKQAKHYEQKAIDIQQELDEYTENSAQLEKELEASLVQVEKQNRDLEHQNQRLKNEIELLKNKLERSQHETNALENEVQNFKLEKDKQATYVRELEQKNDDLERGQRVITESASYIEALLNQAYERNAVLESEMDEVEALRVRLQRATDEARDLKQELKVVERVPPEKEKEDPTNDNSELNGHAGDAIRAQVETETQTHPITPLKRELNGNTLTPSSRVSAINIVGDLLRKVGLERFLCPDCGKVRCSCAVPEYDTNPSREPVASCVTYNCKTSERENGDGDFSPSDIEYRQSRPQLQQHYENLGNSATNSEMLMHNKKRNSEQTWVRGTTGENGKLRRSFIVRSREGIENLLSFTSARKSQDNGKTRPPLSVPKSTC